MFCPRCHTELPDAAYACSTCGTVVSPVSLPSSALPTLSSSSSAAMSTMSPASYQPQPASFSYLPAGAPQWPAVVLPVAPVSSVPGGTSPDAWSTEPSTAIAAEKPPVRRSSLGVPRMLLIFFVCVVVGGGLTFGLLQLGRGNNQSAPNAIVHPASTAAATTTPGTGAVTPTPTTTNQLPTPTSFLTLTNNDVNLSFKYPSDWTIDPPQSTTQSAYVDLHPTPQNGLIINLEHFSTSGSANFKTTSDVNNNNLTQLQGVSGLTNFQSVKPTTSQQTIGTVTWDEEDVTFQNSSGLTFYFVTIAARYKNQFYDIFYSAPQTVFTEAVQKYFQPMLGSLKFLS